MTDNIRHCLPSTTNCINLDGGGHNCGVLTVSRTFKTPPKLDFIHWLEASAQETSRISDLISDFLNVGYSSDMRKSSRVE